MHAWFLEQVQRHDAGLAKAIHDDQGPKPFTCSSLNGPRSREQRGDLTLTPDSQAWLRRQPEIAANGRARAGGFPEAAGQLAGRRVSATCGWQG